MVGGIGVCMSAEQKSHVTKHVTSLPPVGEVFTSFFGCVTNEASAYELSGKTLHFRFADTFTRLVIYSLFVVDSSDQP